MKVSKDRVNEIVIKHTYIENGVVSDDWRLIDGSSNKERNTRRKKIVKDYDKPPLTDKQQLTRSFWIAAFFHAGP